MAAIRGPLLGTLAMLAVLLGLGVWQLHRLHWKRGILAEIARAEAAPPIPLPARPTRFEKVSVTGRWVPGRAALYADEVRQTPAGPVQGGELIMGLARADGTVVLVDLGWVPQTAPAPIEPAGNTAVGYIHEAVAPGPFSGTDDPARRLFYTLDPARIGAALGFPRVAPFTLIAMGQPPARGWPIPQRSLPRPRNAHLEYALTWFSFAIVLVAIFLAYARKRLAGVPT